MEDEEDRAEAAAKAEEGEAPKTEGIMTLPDAVLILGLAAKPTKDELIEVPNFLIEGVSSSVPLNVLFVEA